MDQSWIDEWTRPVVWKDRAEDELGPWLRARPRSLRPLLVAFPVSCVVVAMRPLLCPAPGTCGVLAGYLLPSSEFPLGALAVRQSPSAVQSAICEPQWIVAVGYWRGLTPEVARWMFSERGAP
jgi:hypothetical protein